MLAMTPPYELEPPTGWGTRQELEFLEACWAGKLQTPNGMKRRQTEVLHGYARSFTARRRWAGIHSDIIRRWLVAHGYKLP